MVAIVSNASVTLVHKLKEKQKEQPISEFVYPYRPPGSESEELRPVKRSRCEVIYPYRPFIEEQHSLSDWERDCVNHKH